MNVEGAPCRKSGLVKEGAMELPTGLVCTKCGTTFGAILKPSEDKLRGLQAVCVRCVSEAAQRKGITLDTPENWAAALSD